MLKNENNQTQERELKKSKEIIGMEKQKKYKNSTDELLTETFLKLFENCYKQTEMFIEFYSKQIDYYQKEINLHLSMKPIIIFKKKYKKWQIKLDTLEKQLYNTYIKIGEEYQEKEKLIELINTKN